MGSVLLCEFSDRAALDAYLAEEPFARERIWQDISVYPIHRVDWDALFAPARHPSMERLGRGSLS